MRARKLALWAGRLAVIAALGAGAALSGNAVATAEARWGSVEQPTPATEPAPGEARWDSVPSGEFSTMLEPRWD